MSKNTDVTVQDMLAARDARVQRQLAMQARWQGTVVSLTMNIAGPVKVTPWIARGFDAAVALVEAQLDRHGVAVRETSTIKAHTGHEALWAVDADAGVAKRLLCAVEDADRFGRLLDIDVISADGVKVARDEIGKPPRRCLLCGGEAMACARSRTHTVEALQAETQRILQAHFAAGFADWIAGAATRALLEEVAVTPKPGLVDRANNGAHRDMDIFTFLDSAAVLSPYFRKCALAGVDAERLEGVFPALRYLGMCAEDGMLGATGGANTHKGAVFSLGILCAAAGYAYGQGMAVDVDALCRLAVEMTGETLHREVAGLGEASGARGEVLRGFASVRRHGLPALREKLVAGMSLNDAGVYALLSLMANVVDTNIIRRSDTARAHRLMAEAQAVLDDFSLEAAKGLDDRLIAAHISPGGCADLLAVTFFFRLFETERRPYYA